MFNWLVRVPFVTQAVPVLFMRKLRILAVSVLEMLEHGSWCYIRKAPGMMFENREVERFDSGNDLPFQFLEYLVVGVEFHFGLVESAVGFNDLRASCGVGMDNGGWCDWGDEGDIGMGEVCGSWHEEGTVSVGASTTMGVNGMGIFVQFLLEECKACIVGLAGDRGEDRFREQQGGS
jgi:hypothetical protein